MNRRFRLLSRIGVSAVVFAVTAGCSTSGDEGDVTQAGAPGDPRGTLFTKLPSNHTGIDFTNRLRESDELNVFTYRNFYNGGGVAIGELSGDSLPEVVLTSNMDGPSLYLNRGQFRFRDITKAAGLRTRDDSWTTGVALADVNGDGLLDIYLCRAGLLEPAQRANELWIHQGVGKDGMPTFEEMAEEYGVADEGYSIHAAFLDFDRDGDLDLFVINNSPRPANSFGLRNVRDVRDPYGGGKLFRNDPSADAKGGRRFTDVSAAAGIHSPENAFGLGVVASDVNRDGWPDLYVANDFFERDYLYINRRDGSFSEALDEQAPIVSYFSMGLDIGDVNNDGWPDIYTTDMLPDDEHRLKTTTMFEGWDSYQAKVRNGYHHQLMRNMLQRNNGDPSLRSGQAPTFTDVGQMAGVERTDWSWSALIADLDLDGRKDIYVTNGLAKDITAQDYIAFLANEETMKTVTGGGRNKVDFERLTKAMGTTSLPDYAFRNEDGLHFSNVAKAWGLDTPNVSSGVAYGDLDGDGALDLVVNNANEKAFVYRNNARPQHTDRHFLRVRLEGEGLNRFAVGARVMAHVGDELHVQEQFPSRGYQSSMDYVLVFGLGARSVADSVVVEWPNGKRSRRTAVQADQSIVLHERDGVAVSSTPPAEPATLLRDVTAALALGFTHQENDFIDFDRERLIPKMLSTEGPAMAVADVDGDGLDDIFIGGAKEQAGRLLMQQRDGRFVSTSESVFEQDKISEDVGALFFDANGDRRPDLYVVSGGNEFSDASPALQDRLYLNDGRGGLRKAEGQLPMETRSGSRVAAADYDGDGDLDLFVGSRVVPWRYGVDPTSMLLQNDGRGRFTDVTMTLAPEIARAGMVTDALWHDIDADGKADLVVVGEWMPISIFRNAGKGLLEPLRAPGLEKSAGWWNRIVAGDFTGDGRADFVVGNFGLNGRLRASAQEPVTMYVKDFDQNGFVEQVVATYNQGASYPLVLRDDMLRALPHLKQRYPSYTDYARQKVTDIFSPADLRGAVEKKAETFATTLIRSDGNGAFTLVPLHDEAQLAPVYGMLAADVDGDRHVDLLLAGNFAGLKPEIGRMFGSRGLLLRGNGKGALQPVHPAVSGFVVPGEARDIQRLKTARGVVFVVVRNDDSPLLFAPATRGAVR